MTMTQKHWSLLLLIALALGIRVIDAHFTGGLGQSPSLYREYVFQGERLLRFHVLSCPLVVDDSLAQSPSSTMPPAYGALVALVYATLGIESFAATLTLHLINAAATALVVLFVWLAARRILNERAAWIAAVIVAINPALFGFTELIWDTSLFCLGVSVTVWLASLLAERSRSGLAWLGYGLWLGALALLNPAMTIAYPVLVLWPASACFEWRFRPIARAVTLAVLGWAIAITPWTIRNYVHFDQLIYIRGGLPMELWLGACPEAGVEGALVHTRRFPLENDREQERLIEVGEEAYFAECLEKAKAAIADDPVRWVKLIGLRSLDFWFGTLFTHTMPGKGPWPKTTTRWAPFIFYTAEAMIVIVGLICFRRLPTSIRWLIVAAVLFSVTYCVLKVQIRFRAPMEPLIAIVVAAVLQRFIHGRIQDSRSTPMEGGAR